uniref:carbohydrate-binding protein n=1 Tax=uncultured Fibrobacter sp. TaxID=261512 RepID=UPI0025D65352
NYDVGGHNKAFYDNDRENQGEAYRQDEVDIVAIDDSKCGDAACTGFAIGYTNEGEWVEYTVNVAADATYKITANVATASDASAMQLLVDDKEITESVAIEKIDTVWTTYKVVDVGSVELKKGEHVLKLLITGGYLNVDWLQFTDPNAESALVVKTPLVNAAKSQRYEVFSVSGKRLGRVNVSGGTIAESLKMAGYRPGIYMVRNASGVHVVNTAK